MKLFAWKENTTNDHIPYFMDRYIEYSQLKISTGSARMNMEKNVTNIVISDLSETKQMRNYSSCYVPNIYDIISSKDIMSQCNFYSMSHPSAVVNIGVKSRDVAALSLKNKKKSGVCSAIIIDKKHLNDRHTQNIYGFETKLAAFSNSICDDIIYSPCKKSLIGYQSFHSKSNKLFYLNKNCQNWQLLNTIYWKKSASPATMVQMNGDKQLFISTNSGESIAMDLVQNKWQKLPRLRGVVKQYSFDEIALLPKRPVFAYDKYRQQMIRMNLNDKNTNFYFDMHQMKWIQMKFKNMMSDQMLQQKLWISDASRHILYATICTRNKVLCAYYDQRDHRQKKWKTMFTENQTHHNLSVPLFD